MKKRGHSLSYYTNLKEKLARITLIGNLVLAGAALSCEGYSVIKNSISVRENTAYEDTLDAPLIIITTPCTYYNFNTLRMSKTFRLRLHGLFCAPHSRFCYRYLLLSTTTKSSYTYPTSYFGLIFILFYTFFHLFTILS